MDNRMSMELAGTVVLVLRLNHSLYREYCPVMVNPCFWVHRSDWCSTTAARSLSTSISCRAETSLELSSGTTNQLKVGNGSLLCALMWSGRLTPVFRGLAVGGKTPFSLLSVDTAFG